MEKMVKKKKMEAQDNKRGMEKRWENRTKKIVGNKRWKKMKNSNKERWKKRWKNRITMEG